MTLPETRLSRVIDGFISRIATYIGLIWLLLMAIIVVNVIARYLLSEGRIEFEELQWHLYSIGFMLALGYGLISDSHIRVDVFHERLPHRAKLWIDFYGILIAVVPFSILILWYGWDFVAYSFSTSEISASPGGLPHRWLIKGVMLAGFLLLLLASISRLSRILTGLLQRGT